MKYNSFTDLVNGIKHTYYDKHEKRNKVYQLLYIIGIDEEDETRIEYINLGFYSSREKAEEAWKAYKNNHEDAIDCSIREHKLDTKDCWTAR